MVQTDLRLNQTPTSISKTPSAYGQPSPNAHAFTYQLRISYVSASYQPSAQTGSTFEPEAGIPQGNFASRGKKADCPPRLALSLSILTLRKMETIK
ncbi:MAG: hypothetical protein NZ602_01490 [Thermoguttaceae bacterium]|nr:hypothetical protein [Thermoguttaceae bacterium]MDW8037461.1 hypothetical protein [Thermoguttaceae bacterium]